MSRKPRRMAALAVGLATGALVMQSPNFACESFMGETVLATADFCFIFDCNSGILGGTLQPCVETVDASGANTGTLLLDCP